MEQTNELKQPVLEEQDFVLGSKTISVPKRTGECCAVTVRGMNWRVAHTVARAGDSGSVQATEHCVVAGSAAERDALLDSISPIGLAWILDVGIKLTMGVKVEDTHAPERP